MRRSSLVACMSLGLTVTGAFAQAPGAVGTRSSTTSSVGSTTGVRTHGARDMSNNILCASLLGSGILGDVLSVAPIVPVHPGDAASAVQFAPIWSESHQAAVVGHSQDAAPTRKPAAAIVRLPISFSDVDRQKFEAAGWKVRTGDGVAGVSYCLTRASAEAAAPVTSMICVVPAT